MKSSIGNESPENLSDTDKDGTPDQAEREFSHDGEIAHDKQPRHPRPGTAHPDDEGLESTRESGGAVVPPPSN